MISNCPRIITHKYYSGTSPFYISGSSIGKNDINSTPAVSPNSTMRPTWSQGGGYVGDWPNLHLPGELKHHLTGHWEADNSSHWLTSPVLQFHCREWHILALLPETSNETLVDSQELPKAYGTSTACQICYISPSPEADDEGLGWEMSGTFFTPRLESGDAGWRAQPSLLRSEALREWPRPQRGRAGSRWATGIPQHLTTYRDNTDSILNFPRGRNMITVLLR